MFATKIVAEKLAFARISGVLCVNLQIYGVYKET